LNADDTEKTRDHPFNPCHQRSNKSKTMNQFKLIFQSIRHYLFANVWLSLAVSVTTAVITGGLLVGDSVKYSLEKAAQLRLGEISHVLTSGDRYFTTSLAEKLVDEGYLLAAAMQQEAVASANGGQLSLNRVNVWGVDPRFAEVSGMATNPFHDASNAVSISQNLARRLNLAPGDELLLTIEKASLIPANAPFVSDEEQTVPFRTTVANILTDEEMGRLNLQTSQTAPLNVFLPLETLNALMDMQQKANVLFFSGDVNKAQLTSAIQQNFQLADASLHLIEAQVTDEWELRSDRVFIEEAIIRAVENSGTDAEPILSYFTNAFRAGEQETPYSFIATLPDEKLGSGEIVINTWLAEDLQVHAGDSLELEYYLIGPLRQLTTEKKSLLIKEIVPIEGYFSDQSLMPHIPGLSDSESCRDWQTGVPVDLKSIRDKDEDYWYEYRGLPKAFVAFSTAQQWWANRYGSVTAFRFPRENLSLEELELRIAEQLDPFALDFQLREVRDEGQLAAQEGTDFSQLFIGLSFFIILTGIILIALLFRFNLEKRAAEIGTLVSLGFSHARIRSIYLLEGLLIVSDGAITGLLLAMGYNKLVFWGLSRVWNDIVRTEVLVTRIDFSTLMIGFLISISVALLTLWFTLNKKLKQSAASLQKRTVGRWRKSRKIMLSIVSFVLLFAGLGLLLNEWLNGSGNLNASLFFIAGAMLLLAVMLFFYRFLLIENRKTGNISTRFLMIRNMRMNRARSLAVVWLLAMGTYVVVSTGLNRKDLFSEAGNKAGGTGAFLFWAETTIPLLHDLNSESYRNEQGFTSAFSTLQMLVADGDDASCLNLNRIANPRILGVDAKQLEGRFALETKMESVNDSAFWEVLRQPGEDYIPAIADQTVIQWGLGKKVGDTLYYRNALGDEVKLLLVAGLKASVFQGNVLIDAQHFLKHFPTSSGSKVFLIDGDIEQQQAIADELTLVYRDHGLELTSAPERLANFMTITNTYLTIFLLLGAMGLLLGTIGLAIVVQRSLLERKAEFALLASLGFKRRTIFRLMVSEYILLMGIGLLTGFVSAVISVFPVIHSTIENVSMGFVLSLMVIIFINGLVWIGLLAAYQLRKMKLIEALRNE
jgi:putative ABC transport system permease protein